MGRTCETSRTCTGACGSRTCMFHEPFQEARGQRPVREARTHVGLRATRAGERETRSGGRDAQGSAALGRKTDPMGRRELLTDTEAHGDRGSRPIGPTSSESKERPDGPTWLCPAGRCLRSSRGLSFPPPATHRRRQPSHGRAQGWGISRYTAEEAARVQRPPLWENRTASVSSRGLDPHVPVPTHRHVPRTLPGF